MKQGRKKIGIIGAGAWGTALASVARRAGNAVTIWAYEEETANAINRTHENSLFLPGVPLDEAITATTRIEETLEADAVLLVTPAQSLRPILTSLAPHWREGVPAILCSKGIEQESALLMSEVAAETLENSPLCVLSGPTFAIEVAQDKPTAVTLACKDHPLGESLAEALGGRHFRPYLTDDIIGTEIGGAVKNVLAIASGIVIGRGMGENARAALITRGLAELVRLGVAKGGRSETMMGLSGFGDICLTCSSEKSRNMSLGIEIGKGKSVADILSARISVAEGVYTAASVTALAGKIGIELPICEAVNRVLSGNADIDSTIEDLLSRPFTRESGQSK